MHCSSAGSPSTRETGRPDGLPVPYCSHEQEVQVAILGDTRPEFQAGGNWKSRSAVGEGRAQPVYAVLHWAGTELVDQVCQGLDHSSAYQTRKLRWREVRGALLATAKMNNSHA